MLTWGQEPQGPGSSGSGMEIKHEFPQLAKLQGRVELLRRSQGSLFSYVLKVFGQYALVQERDVCDGNKYDGLGAAYPAYSFLIIGFWIWNL